MPLPQPGVNCADYRQCHSPWPHHVTAAANISYVADGERAGTFFITCCSIFLRIWLSKYFMSTIKLVVLLCSFICAHIMDVHT